MPLSTSHREESGLIASTEGFVKKPVIKDSLCPVRITCLRGLKGLFSLHVGVALGQGSFEYYIFVRVKMRQENHGCQA